MRKKKKRNGIVIFIFALLACILVPLIFFYEIKSLTVSRQLYDIQTKNQQRKEALEKNLAKDNIDILMEKNKEQIDMQRAEDDKKAAEEAQKKAEKERAQKLKDDEDKYNNAYNLYVNGDYYDTMVLCNEIINDFDDYYKAFSLRGIANCFTMAPGAFDVGMGDIDTALSLKPDYSLGMYNKGLAFDIFGHYDDALVWYEKSIYSDGYAYSYYNKAVILAKEGNLGEVVNDLKIAIVKKPEIKNILKNEQNEKFYKIKNEVAFQNLLK